MQKIKVSLVGYGYWGPKLARNFQNSNFFNLVSIIDTSGKNLKKAKKDFPLAQISKNYNDILKTQNISLVVIASPTKTHFKIAKFALENKKHILVEKPLSISLKEVKRLESLARKNKVLLFVDYPFLFSGSIRYMKKIIDTKKYGNLAISRDYKTLIDIAENKGPKKSLVILGYSGWEEGQLEGEMEREMWMLSEVDIKLIFQKESKNKWINAYKKSFIKL